MPCFDLDQHKALHEREIDETASLLEFSRVVPAGAREARADGFKFRMESD